MERVGAVERFDRAALLLPHNLRERARELLGLSGNMRVPLFFGCIREYKGLKHLIRALGILKKRGSRLLDESFVLYVVGDFGSQEKKNEYL